MLPVHIRLELSSLFDLYEFWTQHHQQDFSELQSSWDRMSKKWGESEELVDHFVDERYRLDLIRHELGYAMAILLCSVTEEGLRSILRQIERNDPDRAIKAENKKYRRRNFLERYVRFHADQYGTDFMSGVAPPTLTRQQRMPLPEVLDTDLATIDINLLFDFIWARNRIVHDRGAVRKAQIFQKDGTRKRDVPLSGESYLVDEERISENSIILMRREYLERVIQHLVAFFDKVSEDLRGYYR